MIRAALRVGTGIFITKRPSRNLIEHVSGRLLWPDIARGIAIALVVLHHAARWCLDEGLVPESWSTITEFLRTMRMPLFFLVSGIFAKSWIFRKSWLDLFRSKILLLGWVYMVWCTLRWFYFLIMPRLGTPEPFYLSRLLIAPIWPTNELWFLYALAVFFIVSKLIFKLPLIVVMTTSAVVSALSSSQLIEFSNSAIESSLSYFVFFAAGAFFSSKIMLLVARMKVSATVGAIAVWITAYFASLHLGLQDVLGVPVVLQIVGAFSGLLIARSLCHMPGSAAIGWLGRHTLPVYVCHVFWIITIVGIILDWGGIPYVADWSLPLIISVISASTGIAVWGLANQLGLAWLYEVPRWLRRRTESLPIRS